MEGLERYVKPAIIVLVVGLVGIVSYFVYQAMFGTSFSNGLYTDNKYGFEIQLPPDWREMTSEEEEQVTKAQKYNWDVSNRFFATTTTPLQAAFSVVAIDKDQNVPVDMVHAAMVKGFSSIPQAEVQLDEVKSIGGFEVHRVGIQILKMQYVELIFFQCDKGVIMMGFQAMEPVSDATFTGIDAAVASLRKL
ncbi:MAG: hypothetical protein AUK47_06565 [Deltaproteobacteria bacterium CG2_30_63_29]|nr:MAG: hypothetical protein AUK47_06565 [Deltaproteobacteria bacterium CG2_30_63_29]PJB34458.1 MAG: hypothetical protein CO108_28270 [Deltaproteobacteria bacterium CG_4_9_14_3_um_filter_63_12]